MTSKKKIALLAVAIAAAMVGYNFYERTIVEQNAKLLWKPDAPKTEDILKEMKNSSPQAAAAGRPLSCSTIPLRDIHNSSVIYGYETRCR